MIEIEEGDYRALHDAIGTIKQAATRGRFGDHRDAKVALLEIMTTANRMSLLMENALVTP